MHLKLQKQFIRTEALIAATFFKETFAEQKNSRECSSSCKKETLKETFLTGGVVASSANLRRLVEEGAVTNITTNNTVTIEDLHSAPKEGVYKIGKKEFRKID